MSENGLLRISKVSKLVRILILFVTCIHLGSFVVTLLLAEHRGGHHEVKIKQGTKTFTASANADEVDSDLGRALEAADLNSLAILGSLDLVFYALLYLLLYRLFGQYQHGEIFAQANIQSFKYVGYCLLVWVIADLVYPVLVVAVVRLGGWSHDISLFFSIGSSELIRLLVGLVVYVIGWVMAEANTLHQEQELVI